MDKQWYRNHFSYFDEEDYDLKLVGPSSTLCLSLGFRFVGVMIVIDSPCTNLLFCLGAHTIVIDV